MLGITFLIIFEGYLTVWVLCRGCGRSLGSPFKMILETFVKDQGKRRPSGDFEQILSEPSFPGSLDTLDCESAQKVSPTQIDSFCNSQT